MNRLNGNVRHARVYNHASLNICAGVPYYAKVEVYEKPVPLTLRFGYSTNTYLMVYASLH